MANQPLRPSVAIGETYGRLTITSEPWHQTNKSGKKEQFCSVLCSCGTEKTVRVNGVKQGHCTSCGCYKKDSYKLAPRNIKHGNARKGKHTRLWGIWTNVRQRCSNPNASFYKYYGGMGVSVCDEWQGFLPFEKWALANGYTDELTIDRIDPNGNYEPANCRWVTQAHQVANRRNCRHLTCFGETKTLGEWGRDPRCPICTKTLRDRILSGWEHEKAITTPRQQRVY